jgi:hypothetical protein
LRNVFLSLLIRRDLRGCLNAPSVGLNGDCALSIGAKDVDAASREAIEDFLVGVIVDIARAATDDGDGRTHGVEKGIVRRPA